MAFWNRNVDKPTGPSAPPPQTPPPLLPEVQELAELISRRDAQEHYLWQPYVDRITRRFDGLPAPNGDGSFVRACLAAGCKAVPVIKHSTLWEKDIERHEWSGRFESDLATCVRLGLFFAASLRYLAHTLCRLRVKIVDGHWHPLSKISLGAGEVRWRPLLRDVSFRELDAQIEGGAEISWLDVLPSDAQACTVAACFLQTYEISLLTPELAADVMDCAMPRSSGGLFRRMLFDHGHIEPQRVNVSGLCLEAVRQLSWSGRLQLNSNPGDLFVTPELSFLVTPRAVDMLLGVLRRRGHSFTRLDIYRGLGDAGCLVGIRPGARKDHTRQASLDSPAWRRAFPMRGLAIAHDALWDIQPPPAYFDGTVTIQD